jgi:hypothetical protein
MPWCEDKSGTKHPTGIRHKGRSKIDYIQEEISSEGSADY